MRMWSFGMMGKIMNFEIHFQQKHTAMIKRYFSSKVLISMKKDFDFLFPMLDNFFGEVDFSIRDNYFNLYYKGNSLAKVRLKRNGFYSVSISNKFFQNSKVKKDNRFSLHLKSSGENTIAELPPKLLYPFFQRTYINDLCSQIRIVNNGEEIEFEQSIITDNIDNPAFFIIDRQITETTLKRKRIDLLALKRLSETHYRFVVVEVKLGKNKDLKQAVVGQLADYIAHIKANINEFADCYEKNYSQKQYLGLIHPPLPSGLISIDRKEAEGMIVVGSYSKIAKSLMSTLVFPHSIQVKKFEFKLP